MPKLSSSTSLISFLILLLFIVFFGGLRFVVNIDDYEGVFSSSSSENQKHPSSYLQQQQLRSGYSTTKDKKLWSETDEFDDDGLIAFKNKKSAQSTDYFANFAASSQRCLLYRFVDKCSCMNPESADGSICAPGGIARCVMKKSGSGGSGGGECLGSGKEEDAHHQLSSKNIGHRQQMFRKIPSTKFVVSSPEADDFILKRTVELEDLAKNADAIDISDSTEKMMADTISYLNSRDKSSFLTSFHRSCREQRKRGALSEESNSSSGANNVKNNTSRHHHHHFYRCRADSLPVNPERILPLDENALQERSNSNFYHHLLRFFCVFENHMGITNIELSLATCFGVALDFARKMSTERIAFGVDVVLPFSIDHRKEHPEQPLQDIYDFDFLRDIATRYGIRKVIVAPDDRPHQQSANRHRLENDKYCSDQIWKELSEFHAPFCCLADARLLASRPIRWSEIVDLGKGAGDAGLEVLFRDEIEEKKIEAQLSSADEDNNNSPKTENDHNDDVVFKKDKKKRGIIGSTNKKIKPFTELGLEDLLPVNAAVSYAERIQQPTISYDEQGNIEVTPPVYRAMSIVGTSILRKELLHFQFLNSPTQRNRHYKRSLDRHRWFSNSQLILKSIVRDYTERKSSFLKRKQRQDPKYPSDAINSIEFERDWNWCLNRTAFPRMPSFQTNLDKSTQKYVESEENSQYLLSFRLQGVSFSSLLEYRSGSFLPTLDWLQPTIEVKRASLKFMNEMERISFSSQDTKFTYLAVHLRSEPDALGWLHGALSSKTEYPRFHKQLASLTDEAREHLHTKWDPFRKNSMLGADAASGTEIYFYMDLLLKRIDKLADDLNVDAVFFSNLYAPVSSLDGEIITSSGDLSEMKKKKKNKTKRWLTIARMVELQNHELVALKNSNQNKKQRTSGGGGEGEQQAPPPILPSLGDDKEGTSKFGTMVRRVIAENADYALVWDPFSGVSSFSQKVYDYRCRKTKKGGTFSYSVGVSEERDESFVMEC